MKKCASVLASCIFLPAFFGCSTTPQVPCHLHPDVDVGKRIMITWFRYHNDLVEEIRCSSNIEELNKKTEEAIAARQGIVRDLSEYQHEGVMSASDVEVWYQKLKINLGTENIAYVAAYERLTGNTAPVNLR